MFAHPVLVANYYYLISSVMPSSFGVLNAIFY